LKVKDEIEIRTLAYKFNDVANQKNGEDFQSLRVKNEIWEILPLINMVFKGIKNILCFLL
jgi:hypothetical protein